MKFDGLQLSKNAFLQLKHYIQRIYRTLLSTVCVKIHQTPYVIFETISHFLRHNSLYFLTQLLHTFYKSSPSKCKFPDFPLLALKLIQFLISYFKQKLGLSTKFGSFFSVRRDNLPETLYAIYKSSI